MTPITYFHETWQRCDIIKLLHAYVFNNATAALQPEELLRAEWAARVSALDLYIHEVIAQNLGAVFAGSRTASPGFSKLKISAEALIRINTSTNASEKNAAFDLDVRSQLGRISYQFPDDIANGIRLISDRPLWNDVAAKLGAPPANVITASKSIKQQLSAIAERRNKIVHEGDLQPSVPRTPWPITYSDVRAVEDFIKNIVEAIDALI